MKKGLHLKGESVIVIVACILGVKVRPVTCSAFSSDGRRHPHEGKIFCEADLRKMQGHQEKGSDQNHL